MYGFLIHTWFFVWIMFLIMVKNVVEFYCGVKTG